MQEHLLINFPLEAHLVQEIKSWNVFASVQHYPSNFVEKSDHPNHFWGHEPAEIPAEVWQKATVLLTMVWIPDTAEQAPNLRFIQAMSAGLEHLFARSSYLSLPAVKERLQLCSAAGVHSSSIAEHVMMHLLAHYHRLRTLYQIQSQRWWNRTLYVPPGSLAGSAEMRGQTMGVVGYGCIGREVARLAASFGMRVLAASSSGKQASARGYTIEGTGDAEGTLPAAWFPSGDAKAMEEFWRQADVVVLACPLTDATHHLVNAESLRHMKKTAYLVNIARGGVVDQEALMAALENETLAGAYVDVTDPEPLPKDHALWTTKHCTVTPHLTGATTMYETRCVDLLKENMAKLAKGEALVNGIDLKKA